MQSKDATVTYRQLRRANTVLELVRHHVVIEDPTKIFKVGKFVFLFCMKRLLIYALFL